MRDQLGGVVGSDGENFLIAWINGNVGTIAPLYIGRVDSEGHRLDGFGILLSPTAFIPAGNPAGAWGASNYLVVWGELCDFRVCWKAITVDRDGRVGSTITLPIDGSPFGPVSVASDGTRFLVVWTAINPGRAGYAALISEQSNLVRGPYRVTPDGEIVEGAKIASSRTGFRLFYAARTDLWTTPIDVSGNPGTPRSIESGRYPAPPFDFFAPSIASNGSDWVIVNGFADAYLEAVILRGDGSVIGPVVVEPATFYLSMYRSPQILWAGNSFMLFYADCCPTFMVFRSIGIDGAIGQKRSSSLTQSDPARMTAAWNGSRILLSYATGGSYDPQGLDLFATLLAPDFTSQVAPVQQAIPVVLSAHDQRRSSVASNGRISLHVWEEWISDARLWQLFAGRVTADWTRPDGLGLRVSVGGEGEFHPATVFDGTNFVVVWQELATLRGNRISPDGRLLDGQGFVISKSACYADRQTSIANNGRTLMVVWTDCALGETRQGSYAVGRIFAARINATGQVIDPAPLRLSFGPLGEQNPAVAAVGRDFLVVWEENGTPPPCFYEYCFPPQTHLVARRVSDSGTVIDANVIPIAAGGNAAQGEKFPSIASDGSTAVVTWSSNQGADVRYARVNANGQLLDVQPDQNGRTITDIGKASRISTVVWDGIHFVILRSKENGSLVANRLSGDGVVVDSDSVVLSANPGIEAYPSAAMTSPGVVIVDAARQTDDALYGHGVVRIFARNLLDPLRRRAAGH